MRAITVRFQDCQNDVTPCDDQPAVEAFSLLCHVGCHDGPEDCLGCRLGQRISAVSLWRGVLWATEVSGGDGLEAAKPWPRRK